MMLGLCYVCHTTSLVRWCFSPSTLNSVARAPRTGIRSVPEGGIASLCHLGDLIDALYSRVKVRLLVVAHCRDALGGIGCGAEEEILYRILGDNLHLWLGL